MTRTDAELIDAHRRGDTSAVDELIARHLGRVRKLLFQLVLDRDLADELTQEVFIRVLKNLHRFRGEAAFTSWLHRIAVNAAQQAFRQARIRRSEIAMVPIKLDHIETAPDVDLIRNEQRDDIHRALERLSLPLRTAIVLTVMQGLSAIEAALIEGCPVGTIYWRVHEARRLMKHDLKGHLE